MQEIFRSKNLIPCTGCRYCTDGCPKHIAIPDLFATMNAKQIHHRLERGLLLQRRHTAPGRRASDCVKCGKCEKVCPQHLPIRQLLQRVAHEFEKALRRGRGPAGGLFERRCFDPVFLFRKEFRKTLDIP